MISLKLLCENREPQKDLIPDFLVPIGLIDDFIFFLFGINIVISIYRATFTQNP